MYILIVEDNKFQFEQIKRSLTEDEAYQSNRIERIKTESEFRKNFEIIAADPPDVIILDIMMKWADKTNWIEPPLEIADEGFYIAGVRCEKMLAADERTKTIPIIVYSLLNQNETRDLLTPRPQIKYLDKDFSYGKLRESLGEINR